MACLVGRMDCMALSRLHTRAERLAKFSLFNIKKSSSTTHHALPLISYIPVKNIGLCVACISSSHFYSLENTQLHCILSTIRTFDPGQCHLPTYVTVICADYSCLTADKFTDGWQSESLCNVGVFPAVDVVDSLERRRGLPSSHHAYHLAHPPTETRYCLAISPRTSLRPT